LSLVEVRWEGDDGFFSPTDHDGHPRGCRWARRSSRFLGFGWGLRGWTRWLERVEAGVVEHVDELRIRCENPI
jgi:hypothetical protein